MFRESRDEADERDSPRFEFECDDTGIAGRIQCKGTASGYREALISHFSPLAYNSTSSARIIREHSHGLIFLRGVGAGEHTMIDSLA